MLIPAAQTDEKTDRPASTSASCGDLETEPSTLYALHAVVMSSSNPRFGPPPKARPLIEAPAATTAVDESVSSDVTPPRLSAAELEEAEKAKQQLYHLRVQNPNLRPYRFVGSRYVYTTRANLGETTSVQQYSAGRNERSESVAPAELQDEDGKAARAKYFYDTTTSQYGRAKSQRDTASFVRSRGVPQDFTRSFNGFTFEKCLMETRPDRAQAPVTSNGIRAVTSAE